MTFDAGFNRSGYWWPDYAWTDDVRQIDLTHHAYARRVPRAAARAGPLGLQRHVELVHQHQEHEPRDQVRASSATPAQNYVETYGYPNQQIYRIAACAEATPISSAPDSVQVFDYPNNTNSGVNFNSGFVNDMINLTPKLTLNAGVRFDRYASWLPEQGNPGTGPYAVKNLYPENHDFPTYNAWSPRLSLIYDLSATAASR